MAGSDPTPEMDALTPMQRAFVREYLINGRDAKNAGIKAGYAPKSAKVTCSNLLKNHKVVAAIRAEESAVAEKFGITLDRIIAEIASIAFGGMGDFVRISSGGDPIIDLSKATKDQLHTLESMEVEDFTDGRGEDARDVRKVKIKRADKLKALEILGRHFGLGNRREEEAQDRLTQALLEISRRGSAMPIGRGKP